MAQLYKMTLYVCDLEENLSLDEIKTLIKQDALDGCSVNCLTHFADEQVGKQVEWDDNIDLNYTNCPTSAWEKYFSNDEEGYWFLLDECANAGVYCSKCHKKVYKENYANQKLKSRFCPNCGARMTGEFKR
jgi:hypothetical protein